MSESLGIKSEEKVHPIKKLMPMKAI